MPPTRLRRLTGAALLFLAGLCAREAAAQEAYTIRGTVVDAATRRPLPDVAVSLRGAAGRTVTNAQGQYSLGARVTPGTYTVVYTRLGRGEATRSVTLGAERTVQLEPVTLSETAVQLEGLVATGTGAPVERRRVGNTVATVSGEEVNRAPAAATVDQALQGKIAGALISENSGQPGGGVSIRLRGTSSILGGAEPLVVVDGVIIDNNAEGVAGIGPNASRGGSSLTNRLGDISPSDIERVEVLKGAAAAALYGSRANNGVIQIFTRRGSQGRPRVSLNTELEYNTTPKRYALNMSPYAGIADSLAGVRHPDGTRIRPLQEVRRYDIQDQVFRTGLGTTTSLSVSGGSGGTSYFLSGNFRDEEGIIVNTDYRKAGFRGKITQELTSWLEISANGNFVQTRTNLIPEGEQTYGVLTNIIFNPTTFNPNLDPVSGRYPYSPVLSFSPLDVLYNWEAPEEVNRFIGGFEATARPTDDVTVRYLFGLDDYRQENGFLRPPLSQNVTDPGFISAPLRVSRQFNHDLAATHEAGLREGFELSSTLGFRYTSDEAETTSAAAEGIAPGQTLVGGATLFAGQSFSEFRTLGAFLQERLAIADRLFLTGGVNVEASSAFGADERWQLFPRAGLSWDLDREPFFASSPLENVFSTFRVRAAYGQTGAQPPGAYLQENYYFGTAYAARPGFIGSTTLGNPNLRPERQREWEAGFDAGLFGDRAMVEFSYYDKRTDDLILAVELPVSKGLQLQYQNIGEIRNRGVELAVNTVNLEREALTWRSRLTFSANRNKVEKLSTTADTLRLASLGGDYLNAVIKDQPIGVFYGRGYERDANGEILIDPATGLGRRSNNLTIIGDPNPDFSAALSNTFEVGERVEFSFLLDGRFGNDVANFTRRITEFFGADQIVEKEIERELARRDDPTLTPLKYSRNAARISNFEEYVEDGSFVKLREIALRFRPGEAWARRLGAEDLSFRLAGRNLYTWTDYSGLDPEINLFSSNTVARGVDFGVTPLPRSFVFGVDLNF